jgi:hypothetical protein
MFQPRLFPAIILTMTVLVGCYKPVVQSIHRDVNFNVIEPNTIGYCLPKGMINIVFKPAGDQATLQIKPFIVPDPNYFFTISYNPSAFSEDIVGIEFETSNNPQKTDSDKQPLSDTFTDGQRQVFLKKVRTTAQDQWVEIVNKLVQLAKLITIATLQVPTPAGEVRLVQPQVKYSHFVDVVIDPDDPKSMLKRVNDILDPYNIKVTVEGLGFNQPAAAPPRSLKPGQEKGIYTRLVLPYKVSVISTLTPTKDKSSIQGAIRTMVFNLPNGGPIFAPDVTRALFVRKDTVLNFAQGRLAHYQISKPSEALGFVMIPYNLAQEIIKIPTEIFQVKIDLLGRQTQAYQTGTSAIQSSQPQGGGGTAQ